MDSAFIYFENSTSKPDESAVAPITSGDSKERRPILTSEMEK